MLVMRLKCLKLLMKQLIVTDVSHGSQTGKIGQNIVNGILRTWKQDVKFAPIVTLS